MKKTAGKILVLCILVMFFCTNPILPCTSFCIVRDRHAVFGSNLDFHIKTGLIVVNRRNLQKSIGDGTGKTFQWISKYGSLSFNLVGIEMAWSGMNEAGLIISPMQLLQTRIAPPDHRITMDNSVWLQYILDTCSSLGEVVRSLQKIRVQTPDHYLVADRSGNCAVIEFMDGTIQVHKGGNLPASALANDPYGKVRKVWNENISRPKSKRALMREGESFMRFFKAATAISQYSSEKEPDVISYAMNLLDRVSASHTKWSIIYDAQNQKIYYKTCDNRRICWFDFSDFNFDCRAPLRMVRVYNSFKGDIGDQFILYSREIQVDNYFRFAKEYGLNPRLDIVVSITCGLENFGCVDIMDVYYQALVSKGFDHVIQTCFENKSKTPQKYDCLECRLNSFGYFLLKKGKTAEAIRFFSYNVRLHPCSPNCYDSLGEAYKINRNYRRALKNYKKALELNPENPNIKKNIKELEELAANSGHSPENP